MRWKVSSFDEEICGDFTVALAACHFNMIILTQENE
jgi:hypothetical protein